MRRSGSGTHVVVAWVRGWMLFNLSHLLALVFARHRPLAREATPPPPSWGYARGRDYPRTPRPPRLSVARVAALALIAIPRSSPLAFFSQTRHGGSPRLLIRLTRPCPSAAAASFSAGAKDRDLEHAGDALSDAAPSGQAY